MVTSAVGYVGEIHYQYLLSGTVGTPYVNTLIKGICLSTATGTAEKEEDQCELPGCQKPKRKEGTRVHDYCCRDHASQDAPNRDGIDVYGCISVS